MSDWESFYLLTGSAAAALIGLLFIVATLTTSMERSSIERGDKFYMTPIVFNLCVIVVVSAMALAPTVTGTGIGLICGLSAVVGFAYAAFVTFGIWSIADPSPHWSDKYFYGVGPSLAYAAMMSVAAAFVMQREWAANGVAAVVVVLLLLGIRNAWDLLTYLAPKQSKPAAPQDDASEA